MSDLPLDETALQAAIDKVVEVREGTPDEIADILEDTSLEAFATREAISTYLREARFKPEKEYKTISAKYGLADPERRVVGPWVPVVQAESEEE